MANVQQFGRTAQLVVTNQSSTIDLSKLKFRFQVSNADVESPNTAVIRVYNAKRQTVAAIVKEYTDVVLSAGYPGNVAIIFQGSIMQFQFGKESNVDSFIELRCSDGDTLYNFGVVNGSLPGGTTYAERFAATLKMLDVEATEDTNAFLANYSGGVLPRGKVLFGMARAQFRATANGTASRWSIQQGKIVLVPLTGYLSSEAVVVSGATGLIGVPEVTDNGINLQILLNPLVQIGTLLQLNSADISQTVIREQGYPDYGNIAYAATVTPGLGLYRTMVAEYTGDTRGTGGDWVTDITCLAVDPSSGTVAAYG